MVANNRAEGSAHSPKPRKAKGVKPDAPMEWRRSDGARVPAAKDPKLTTAQRERLNNLLLGLTCSDPWRADIYGDIVNGLVRHKSQQARDLSREGIYPPGGREATLMRRCDQCGDRWYPPQYLNDVLDILRVAGRSPVVVLNACICDECRCAMKETKERDRYVETGDVPPDPSPSGVAIQELDRLGVELVEAKLPPEDLQTLKLEVAAQMAHFAATGKLKDMEI